MGFLSGLFHSRDKPTNSTNGSAYRFLFGGSNSGKAVNERSAMQMTAVYACVGILSESVAGLHGMPQKHFLILTVPKKVLSLQRTMRLIPEWNRKSQILARKSLVWRGRKYWMLSLASR